MGTYLCMFVHRASAHVSLCNTLPLSLAKNALQSPTSHYNHIVSFSISVRVVCTPKGDDFNCDCPGNLTEPGEVAVLCLLRLSVQGFHTEGGGPWNYPPPSLNYSPPPRKLV